MKTSLKQAFANCQMGARKRNIGWELTFGQWLSIWKRSGHLSERGPRPHQYCMARYGDKGPYAIGNVKIITNAENNAEYRHSDEAKRKISDANIRNRDLLIRRMRGKTNPMRNPASREKLSHSKMGHEVSDETKAKISASSIGKRCPEVAEANRKRKISEETRAKMSAAQQRRYRSS